MQYARLNKISVLATSVLLSQAIFANEPWSQDRQWLLGDWGGERQQLEQKGYKFNFSFQNETAQNISGGFNNNSINANASQFTFGSHFDLNKIAGWKDTQASLIITKREGNSLSAERIADPRAAQFSSVQEIYGRGQSWRLTQAWIKKGFLEKSLDLKFGRMGLSEDFNASHCEFQNLMLCGGQLGKTVGSIWYNGPVSQWGLNMKYQINSNWSIATGIYEINPDNTLESRGFNLSMHGTKGALFPVELGWKPKLSLFNDLPGDYKVGAFYATAEAADVATNINGQIALKAENRKMHDGKHSFWLNAQQQITALSSDSKRGLFASANFTYNDKATTVVKSSQQVAIWYKGAFDRRPNDQIGLGLARFDVNDRVRERQNYINEVNDLTVSDYTNPRYSPVQHDEIDVELNYSYQWSPSVMLRPNIQFVHQPGGVKQVSDAWAGGLTMRLNF